MARPNLLVLPLGLLALGTGAAIISGRGGMVLSGLLFSAIFVVLLARAEVGIILFMVVSSTLFSYRLLPRISFGAVDFFSTDVLLAATLLAVIYRSGLRRTLGALRSPLTVPLLIFLAVVAYSVDYSRRNSPEYGLSQILSRARPAFFYLYYFAVIAAIRTEAQLRWVIRALLAVALVFAAWQIGLSFGGHAIIGALPIDLFYVKTKSVISGTGMALEDARMKLPGIQYLCLMFVLVLALLGFRRERYGSATLVLAGIVLGLAIVLTFTRMVWLTTLLTIPLILYLSPIYGKIRIVRYGAGIAAGLLLAFSLLALLPSGRYGSLLQFIYDRFATFLAQNVEDQSGVRRLAETRVALEYVSERPWTGIGIHGTMESEVVLVGGEEIHVQEKYGIHNSYLNLLLKLGVPGLLLWLWLAVVAMRRGFSAYRTVKGLWLRGVVFGVLMNFVRLCVNSLSENYILHDWSVSVFALSWGLFEVVHRLGAREAQAVSQAVVPLARGMPQGAARGSPLPARRG